MSKGRARGDPELGALRIVEAIEDAWHSRFGGGGVGAPVSAVAALCLIRPTNRPGPGLKEQILALDAEGCGRTLRRIWVRFARVRPDLIPRVRPLCGWLWSEAASEELVGVQAVAAAVRAGPLKLVMRPQAVDLLGQVLSTLRGDKAMGARGALYTPQDVALSLALSLEIEEDGLVCDLCAGTGGLLLAAVLSMHERGLEPARNLWVANDVDPIAAGCCAVNTHLWGLPHVLIGCGDAIAEDWFQTARTERAEALKRAATTPPSILLGGAS